MFVRLLLFVSLGICLWSSEARSAKTRVIMTHDARNVYMSVTIPQKAWRLASTRGWKYTVRVWTRHRTGWQLQRQGQHSGYFLYWKLPKSGFCARSFGSKRAVVQLGLRAPEGWLHVWSRRWVSRFTTILFTTHTVQCARETFDSPPGTPQAQDDLDPSAPSNPPASPPHARRQGYQGSFLQYYRSYQNIQGDRTRYLSLHRWGRTLRGFTMTPSQILKLLRPFHSEKWRLKSARILAKHAQPFRVKHLRQLSRLFTLARWQWQWKALYPYCRGVVDSHRLPTFANQYNHRRIRHLILRRCR